MIISLVAQGFCTFQVISIPRDFDLNDIRLFQLWSLWNCCFIFYYILYLGWDNKSVISNLIVYLLINKPYRYLDLFGYFSTDRGGIQVDVHVYNSGWAVCFEGVRICQKFHTLIYDIEGI